MCVLFLSYKTHPEYPFLLLANRDEFHERATQAAHYWPDQPGLLAGKDLQLGGTWLGVTKTGRFACVTNYRNPTQERAKAGSRGKLVRDFLLDSVSAAEFVQHLRLTAAQYIGFNLLFGTLDEVFYFSSTLGQGGPLEQGVYGLSNAHLDTPWPKVQRGRSLLSSYFLGEESLNKERLLQIMQDKQRASLEELPDTGVGLEREHFLSPIFITGDSYGTRCTTLVKMTNQQELNFTEISYNSTAEITGESSFSISIATASAAV